MDVESYADFGVSVLLLGKNSRITPRRQHVTMLLPNRNGLLKMYVPLLDLRCMFSIIFD